MVLRGDGAASAQQREGGQGVPRRGRHVQRVAASRVAAREADAALEQHEQHAWVIHEGVPGLHLGDMGLQPGDTQGCMPGHVGLQPLVDRVTAASSVPVRPDAAASRAASMVARSIWCQRRAATPPPVATLQYRYTVL